MARLNSIAAALLLLTVTATAQFIQGPPRMPLGSISYDWVENFEGTGYEKAWTETLNGGTIDEDYATSPAPLQGAQSLYLTDAAYALAQTVSPSFGDRTTTYIYFLYRVAARPSGSATLLLIRNGANVRVTAEMDGAGRISIYGNIGGSGTAVSPVSAISGNTTVHIWITIAKASSPETLTLAWSTTGIRPTTGNNYATGTSDFTNGAIDTIVLMPMETSNPTLFDRVIVNSAQIGDNP